jgi:Ring finger domain
LTVEGAGLLRGISVFTEIGSITTPIVRAVSIKIGELMKWIFNLMLKLFKWIYKLIVKYGFRICYCIYNVFKFIGEKVIWPIYNFIYSVCIFIGEKVIWPICDYIYNVCEAIIKFIRNPPPPPQFLVDFVVNIFLSVVSFFRFLKRCFVTSAQFLHKCFVMIYEFLVWIVNKLYIISVSIYSNMLLPIYHGVVLCLVALYNFLALVVRRLFDFLNLLYNLFIRFSVSIYSNILLPIHRWVVHCIGVIFKWICTAGEFVYVYLLILPVSKFFLEFIFEKSVQMIWEYSMAVVTLAFSLCFFNNLYEKASSSVFSFDCVGFFLGGYVNLVVGAMLLSRCVPNALWIYEGAKFLYKHLDFGFLSLLCTFVVFLGQNSYYFLEFIWTKLFWCLSLLLKGIISFIVNILRWIRNNVIDPFWFILKLGITTIWTNPFMSLVASFGTLYLLYKSQQSIIPASLIAYSRLTVLLTTAYDFMSTLITGAYYLLQISCRIGSVNLLKCKDNVFHFSKDWALIALKKSAFSLCEVSSFGWAVYLIQLVAVQASEIAHINKLFYDGLERSTPVCIDPVFLSRSCMKLVYFPLMFFSVFSSNWLISMGYYAYFAIVIVWLLLHQIINGNIIILANVAVFSALLYFVPFGTAVLGTALLFVKGLIYSLAAALFLVFVVGMVVAIVMESHRRAYLPRIERIRMEDAPRVRDQRMEHLNHDAPARNKSKTVSEKIRKLKQRKPVKFFESDECNVCLEPFSVIPPTHLQTWSCKQCHHLNQHDSDACEKEFCRAVKRMNVGVFVSLSLKGTKSTDISTTNFLYLPCGHKFHDDCVAQWIESHDSCPFCRDRISSVHSFFL